MAGVTYRRADRTRGGGPGALAIGAALIAGLLFVGGAVYVSLLGSLQSNNNPLEQPPRRNRHTTLVAADLHPADAHADADAVAEPHPAVVPDTEPDLEFRLAVLFAVRVAEYRYPGAQRQLPRQHPERWRDGRLDGQVDR